MHYWNDFVAYSAGWSTGSMAVRLSIALVIGVIIGLDRGLKRRGAGIKTHTLVCLASALVMMTGQYIHIYFDSGSDLARLGAQVISGVGFLGVGTIIVTGRNQVQGLTTAAGIWTCACLGLAVGIGYVSGALITLLLLIFTLKVLSKVDDVVHHYSKILDVNVEFDNNKGVRLFIHEMHKLDIKINYFELAKGRIETERPNANTSIEIKKMGQRSTVLEAIRDMEFVRFVEEI